MITGIIKRTAALAKPIFFVSLFILPSIGKSQVAKPGLLWRISGNGLEQPSYLFGTIHLTDKRVFNFGDSLYAAIENCSGYAMELHPDSVMVYFFEHEKDKDKRSPLLKNVVNNQLYSSAKTKLQKEFGKSPDKITVAELRKYFTEWLYMPNKDGKMETFMDAYLYNVVRKQGKWVGGIEDVEDQMGLLDDDDSKETAEYYLKDFMNDSRKSKAMLEMMIDSYTSNDLEQISDLATQMDNTDEHNILVKRNGKMARRIDSLAKTRNTFFAIGSAHLSGDSGVINLLRARGYTVTPVISSKKIQVKDYAFKMNAQPWVKVASRTGLYTAEMPGKPQEEMLDQEDVDLKVYADMGTNLYYFTMGAIGSSDLKLDSVVKKMVKNIDKKAVISGIKDIEQQNLKGIECYAKGGNLVYKIRMFSQGPALYFAMVGTIGSESDLKGDADRFFESFVMNPSPKKVTHQSIELSKPEFGFTINFPLKPELRKGTEDNPSWKTAHYMALDLGNDVIYQCLVRDIVVGYYQQSEVTILEQYKKEIAEKYDLISFRDTLISGYHGAVVEFEGMADGRKYYNKLVNLYRGNRIYVIGATTSKKQANQTQIDSFFHSFALTEIKNAGWANQQSNEAGVKLWANASIKPYQDDEVDKEVKNGLHYWVIYDSLAPITYFIKKDGFSKYYWAKNDTSLLRTVVKSLLKYTDSLTDYNVTWSGKNRAVDAKAKLNNSENIKVMRSVLSGDTVYSIFTIGPREVLERPDNLRLFQGFTVLNDTSKSNLFTNKLNELLIALQSTDSATMVDAISTLEDVPLDAQDLPFLHQALFKKYNDSSLYRKIVDRLTDILTSKKDPSNTEFVRTAYPKLTSAQENMKYNMLSLLASQKTDAAYSLMKDLLSKGLPSKGTPWSFFNYLQDSLAAAKQMYPMLLTYVNDSIASYNILRLTVSLIDSGLIDKKMLLDNKQYLFKYASDFEKKMKQNDDNWYVAINCITLLQNMNVPESNQWLQRLMNLKNKHIKYYAAIALLKNNQMVEPATLTQLAANNERRIDLYDELKKLKKTSLFPKQYYDQEHFAEAELYKGGDDEYSIKSAKLIGERVITFMGQKRKFYLYKVKFDEDEEGTYYLGVSGPFALDPQQVEIKSQNAGIYMDEEFSDSKVAEQFRKFVKREEEYSKDKPAFTK